MSWFTTLFSPILRLFGGRPRDIAIPAPLPGSERMNITDDTSDNSERASEAANALRGYVRPPYQITDRTIHIVSVSAKEARQYFLSRGNLSASWPNNRIGMFYAPKSGFNDTYGLIHLITVKLDQPERVRLAVHEYAHSVWHWLLLDPEMSSWLSANRSPEDFADDLARRLMGQSLDFHRTAFFERLEARLRETGSKSVRG